MEDVPERDIFFSTVVFDFINESVPIRFVAIPVDRAIEGNQSGVVLPDGTGDLIACGVFEVQVFEPVSIDPCASGFNDFPKIGYAGEDGGHEQDGFDPRNVELAQCVNASFGRWGTGFEMAAKCVVKGIDGKGDFDVFQLADQVDVPKNQVGLGDDGDIGPALLQLFEQVPCDPVLLLESVVRVGDGADDDVFARELFCGNGFVAVFDVEKIAPVFFMIREGFHEPGVAVHAFVWTTDVRVDDDIDSGQFRGSDPVFDRDGFCGDHVSVEKVTFLILSGGFGPESFFCDRKPAACRIEAVPFNALILMVFI